jgi:IS5 family transposase
MGTPAKAIRLMVGLIMLKHVRNLSDESVVEQWSENLYYQYFCGEKIFKPTKPCDASELVHFRDRIGKDGFELILQESIAIQVVNKDRRDDSGKNRTKGEKDVIIDTTVQEKNITFPTDDKLYKKIITKCKGIAEEEQIQLRQTYSRTIKRLSYQQRFRKSKKHQSLARKADKRIKTISGRLVRELERKLSPSEMSKYSTEIELYKQVLRQKKDDKNKVYSLHEPHVECISKGKAHKRYEFGSKVSIIIGKRHGIIYGALNIENNDYDGHTLPAALEQFKRINGYEPSRAIVDLGYRGIKQIGSTQIITPQTGKGKTNYQKRRLKQDHRRRASIEGKISHIKHDCRLDRNYYKGVIGDNINVLLSAAGSNLRRWMNMFKKKVKSFLSHFINDLNKILLILTVNFRLKFILNMTF